MPITCPSCGNPFPPELEANLRSGEGVICETCGSYIVSRRNKTTSPAEEAPGGYGTGDSFDGFKEMDSKRSTSWRQAQPVPSGRERARDMHGKDGGVQPRPLGRRPVPGRKAPVKPSSLKQEKIRKRLRDLHAAIIKYNKFSLVMTRLLVVIAVVGSLFYTIGTFSTTFLFGFGAPGSSLSSVFNFIVNPFVGIFYLVTVLVGSNLIVKKEQEFHDRIEQAEYKHYGIDMIITGIAGCFVFGIGTLQIIRGVLVMVYMGIEDRLGIRNKRDKLVEWVRGMNETATLPLLMASLSGITGAAAGITLIVITNGFSAWIPPSITALIVLGILGFVIMNLDSRTIKPAVRKYQFLDIGAKTLSLGIISLACFGAGIFLLVKGILLLALEEEIKRLRRLDARRIMANRSGVTAPQRRPGTPRKDGKAMEGGWHRPPDVPLDHGALATARDEVPHVPGTPEAGTSYPSSSPTIERPFTEKGKTLFGERNPSLRLEQGTFLASSPPGNADAAPAGHSNEPIHPAVSGDTRPRIPADDEYLQRNFGVLTPRVREHLMELERLGLPKEEIDMIAEELVYRAEIEQIEIIDEYIRINGGGEIDPAIVSRVQSMTYNDELKSWILEQVREMADEDVEDFLEGLERSQP